MHTAESCPPSRTGLASCVLHSKQIFGRTNVKHTHTHTHRKKTHMTARFLNRAADWLSVISCRAHFPTHTHTFGVVLLICTRLHVACRMHGSVSQSPASLSLSLSLSVALSLSLWLAVVRFFLHPPPSPPLPPLRSQFSLVSPQLAHTHTNPPHRALWSPALVLVEELTTHVRRRCCVPHTHTHICDGWWWWLWLLAG